MDLSFSPEQQEIRKLAREFAEREVKPRAEAIDHSGEFPRDLVDKAAKLGLLGILVPDVYGGAGLDHVSFAIFVEEVARFCASTAVILDVHSSVGTEPVVLFGTEEQKRRWLPDLAQGKTLAAFAVTDRLGDEGQGFRIAMRALDSGRIGISAQAVGLAQGALDDAVAYARERRQFGRPIAEQQAIQFKLADIQTGVSAARWLTWKAAARCDAGQPFTRD